MFGTLVEATAHADQTLAGSPAFVTAVDVEVWLSPTTVGIYRVFRSGAVRRVTR